MNAVVERLVRLCAEYEVKGLEGRLYVAGADKSIPLGELASEEDILVNGAGHVVYLIPASQISRVEFHEREKEE